MCSGVFGTLRLRFDPVCFFNVPDDCSLTALPLEVIARDWGKPAMSDEAGALSLESCFFSFCVFLVPQEARRGREIARNWHYRCLWTAMLVLGLEIWSSGKVASDLICWAISLASYFLIFKPSICSLEEGHCQKVWDESERLLHITVGDDFHSNIERWTVV